MLDLDLYCFRPLTLAHSRSSFFFFNDTATTEIYTLSLHDALPISARESRNRSAPGTGQETSGSRPRSEEHTSELQSLRQLVCRLLLEKKKRTHGLLHKALGDGSNRQLDLRQLRR